MAYDEDVLYKVDQDFDVEECELWMPKEEENDE